MNLLDQKYEFSTISQPHFAYSVTYGIHQSFGADPNEHRYRSFDESSSSQRHIESSHNQYEICDENLEECEPPEDDGESKTIESEFDENTEDLTQNDTG
ncbi:hypothetical protein H5410_022151 [Solanum commersonii]|uniref:Uncharacterized protein n=1 Tax=Solanum commersonii TaxID=4109 RepID=A0A9J5ZIV7_SOLCO|nr:hypothetical protein H5410_022151 [Solanum commersonii]